MTSEPGLEVLAGAEGRGGVVGGGDADVAALGVEHDLQAALVGVGHRLFERGDAGGPVPLEACRLHLHARRVVGHRIQDRAGEGRQRSDVAAGMVPEHVGQPFDHGIEADTHRREAKSSKDAVPALPCQLLPRLSTRRREDAANPRRRREPQGRSIT
jgi:hypothetical protein